MNGGGTRGRWLPLAAAALVAAWAIMGWAGLAGQARAGFETGAGGEVFRVLPGSPAEAAGLRVGDVIVAIAGVPADQGDALAQLPRPAAGESRAYRISRDRADGAEEMVVTVEFARLPPAAIAQQRVSMVVGLCFLGFPLLAWHHRRSRATRVLLVMGVGLSLAFIDGPYVADAGIRALAAAVRTGIVLAGVAAVVHFLLVFPHPRPWLERPSGKWPVYLPAVLLWALLAWRMLLRPEASGALTVITNLALTVVVVGFLLTALFLVLRNYSRTDRAEREALALNGMLWGTVLGILPAALAQLTATFSPASELPGQDFWFVSLALIPLTWSRSAARGISWEDTQAFP